MKPLSLGKVLKKHFKDVIDFHKSDISSVFPEVRYGNVRNQQAIWLNSCAGLIEFRSGGTEDIATFRNKFVNAFVRFTDKPHAPRKCILKLFKEIKDQKWKYRKTSVRHTAPVLTKLSMRIM